MTFPDPSVLLGRPLNDGEARAFAAQAERLARHLVATPLAASGSLFTAETSVHPALIATLGREAGR